MKFKPNSLGELSAYVAPVCRITREIIADSICLTLSLQQDTLDERGNIKPDADSQCAIKNRGCVLSRMKQQIRNVGMSGIEYWKDNCDTTHNKPSVKIEAYAETVVQRLFPDLTTKPQSAV